MDDCGGAFTMGAIGGGVFQAIKGFRNAPAVSSPHNCLLSNSDQVLIVRIQQCSDVSGCRTQAERQCKRSEGKSSTDRR